VREEDLVSAYEALGLTLGGGVTSQMLSESSVQGAVDVEAFLRMLAWHPLPKDGSDLDQLLDYAWEKRSISAANATRIGRARINGANDVLVGASM
jgi:hypothetical protein